MFRSLLALIAFREQFKAKAFRPLDRELRLPEVGSKRGSGKRALAVAENSAHDPASASWVLALMPLRRACSSPPPLRVVTGDEGGPECVRVPGRVDRRGRSRGWSPN